MAVNLGRHAGIVAAIGLVFTIVIGTGITQLEFETSQNSYLNKDSQVFKDNVAYQDLFGGQAMLSSIAMTEGHTVDELFTPENIEKMRKVEEGLYDSCVEDECILSVITPLTALEFADALIKKTPEGEDAKALTESIAGVAQLRAVGEAGSDEATEIRTADALKTLERAGAIPADQQTIDNPEWVKFLLYDNEGEIRDSLKSAFSNPEHTQVLTRLPGNLSIEDEGLFSDQVVEVSKALQFDNAKVTTTGAPVLLKSINDYLRGGMLTLGGIAVAAMIIILMIFFNVRWRLLPLLVVLIGVIWAFGLAGYFGIPLTLVTIAGLPVMLGIGIDYAIQMHSRVEEEVIIDREAHPIQAAARGLGPALVVVTFDAVFAFLAIQISRVPMVREFGWLLTVGIIAICFSSIINPLAALGIREYRSPTRGRDFSEGPLGRLTVWLGSAPPSTAVALIVVSTAVFVAGSYLEPKLTMETDPVNWVNQSSEVVKDIRVIEEEFGGASEVGVFVKTKGGEPVLTDEYVTWVDDLAERTMDEFPQHLLTDFSMPGTMRKLVTVPGTPSVRPTADLVRAAWDVAPRGIRQATIAEDGDSMNLIFLTRAGALEDRAEVVRALHEEKMPAGITATPSGLAVVGIGLLENLEANLVELTWLAIGLVFLFLCFRLKSIVRALLSVVPVLIASGLATIAIYFLGIELSPMTAVGGPLVVATCTEFTSLMLLRYIEERRRGLDPREAIDVTAARTGRAFIVSAMTAIAGVAVISFSSLPLLSNFGQFVALKIAIAVVAALTILPPLIVWADRHNWVSKGMLDHEEAPYIEVADHKPGIDEPAPTA